MDKEEILKRAQNRKPHQMDEMELAMLQKSSHIGMIVGLFLCVILMIIKMSINQPWQDVYAVFCAMMCGQYIYRWFQQREKFVLFCGILWGISTCALLIAYILNLF